MLLHQRSALHQAVLMNCDRATQLLLDAGANATQPDPGTGRTPIEEARVRG